jgi:hypothetical protein
LNILSEAVKTVRQNGGTVLSYVAILVGLDAAKVSMDFLVDGGILVPPDPVVFRVYQYAADVLLAFFIAVVQAIVFARMGREIDRPLWKVKGDWDAVRRFFPLWFLLSLLQITLLRLLDNFGETAAGILCLMGFFVLFLLYVPLGSCIMFTGNLRWGELPDSLAPLRRQWPYALIVLGLNGVQLLLLMEFLRFLAIHGSRDKWIGLELGLDAVLSSLDCLVFAATWLICMTDRNTAEDIPIDF